MVTSPARLPRAVAAARAFARQTHASRELVVILAGDTADRRRDAAAALEALGIAGLRVCQCDDERSLGALRNLAVAEAGGELLCQWDDDDLYHPERIAAQCADLKRHDAVATVLQDLLHFSEADRTLRWLNWAATPLQGHPGTLLCRRESIVRYPDLSTGEDAIVLRLMAEDGRVSRQAGSPHLYVYVTHGGNTFATEHHAMLAERLARSTGLLRRHEEALRANIASIDFGPGPLAFVGSAGPAFTIG